MTTVFLEHRGTYSCLLQGAWVGGLSSFYFKSIDGIIFKAANAVVQFQKVLCITKHNNDKSKISKIHHLGIVLKQL